MLLADGSGLEDAGNKVAECFHTGEVLIPSMELHKICALDMGPHQLLAVEGAAVGWYEEGPEVVVKGLLELLAVMGAVVVQDQPRLRSHERVLQGPGKLDKESLHLDNVGGGTEHILRPAVTVANTTVHGDRLQLRVVQRRQQRRVVYMHPGPLWLRIGEKRRLVTVDDLLVSGHDLAQLFCEGAPLYCQPDLPGVCQSRLLA